MKKLFALLLGVALIGQAAFAAPSPSASPKTRSTTKTSSTLSKDDKSFLEDALQGNMLEIKLGQVAEKNGTGNAKTFGQKMVTDHTKLLADTEKVAKAKGVAIPKDLNAAGKASMLKYQALKGNAFDSAYLKDMQEDHTKDVAAFKKEEKNTKDPDIKKLIAGALPVIESHLKMVNQDMGSSSGEHTSSGSSKTAPKKTK
ncbi:MAG: DUF4142 domain-containing protein [Candidatus Xenobia bacterium]